MRELGLRGSRLHPGVFWDSKRELFIVSHVDDLLIAGPEAQLSWIGNELSKRYEVKGKAISEDGTLKFLGREIVLGQEGVIWTGDAKHMEALQERFTELEGELLQPPGRGGLQYGCLR